METKREILLISATWERSIVKFWTIQKHIIRFLMSALGSQSKLSILHDWCTELSAPSLSRFSKENSAHSPRGIWRCQLKKLNLWVGAVLILRKRAISSIWNM